MVSSSINLAFHYVASHLLLYKQEYKYNSVPVLVSWYIISHWFIFRNSNKKPPNFSEILALCSGIVKELGQDSILNFLKHLLEKHVYPN